MLNEQRFWQAVVIRNITDALSPDKVAAARRKPGPSPDKVESDRWIRTSRHFYDVCHLAGFDPDWLRSKYIEGKIDYARLKAAEKNRTDEKEDA